MVTTGLRLESGEEGMECEPAKVIPSMAFNFCFVLLFI